MTQEEAKKLTIGTRVVLVYEPKTIGTVHHLTTTGVEILWDDGWYGVIMYESAGNLAIHRKQNG
jgi:hypothetical protein